MKKIMLILVVLVQTTLFAQTTQTIEKPLKLTSVAVGTLSDDVLLSGITDKTVKKISVSSLLVNKANLASPIFTGIPLVPTATVGTNTTQVASTAFVLENSPVTPDATTILNGKIKLSGDLGGTADLPTTPTAIHKTGDETVQGVKTITTSDATPSRFVFVTNNPSSQPSLYLSVFSTSTPGFRGIKSSSSPIIKLESNTANNSELLRVDPKANNIGILVANGSGTSTDDVTQVAIYSNSLGKGIFLDCTATSNYSPIVSKNNGVQTFLLTKNGNVSASSYNVNALNLAPTSATAIGTANEIRFTASGIYICTATNTWIKCVGVTF
jgi:hypothetical protein